MKKTITVITLCFLPMLSISLGVAAKQPIAPRIGNIQDTKEIMGGGCAFHLPGKENSIIFWSTDVRSALMNIDGKDRTLRLVGETSSNGREKLGDRSTSVYRTGKIIVRIDRVTTRVCRLGDEHCESVSYKGKFKLTDGNRSQTIAVSGWCGS